MHTKKIYIILADGYEEIEALTPVDVLRRADFEVVIVALARKTLIKGAHDIVMQADFTLDEISFEDADLIILPGGMPGAKNLDSSEDLKHKILEHHKTGKYLAAICAAPMVLGHLGLLKGKNATCYPGFEVHLEGAVLSRDKVVVDGTIITAEGPGAAMEFSLKLVELLDCKEKALQLAKKLVVN